MSKEDEEGFDYHISQPFDRSTSQQAAVQNDEQKLRKELIQRATIRLKRRLLKQNLQDTMSQIISLQAQLESIRVETAITLDTYSSLFSNDEDDDNLDETDNVSTASMNTASKATASKVYRQLEFLEKRLYAHQASLSHILQPQSQQQYERMRQTQRMNIHTSVPMEKRDSNISALTALSMSRLSSISLISSFFGARSGSAPDAFCESPATSIASSNSECTNDTMEDKKMQLQALQHNATHHNYNDKGTHEAISQIGSLYSTKWKPMFSSKQKEQADMADEDHPFYDLAGKRSFGVGSFCGSFYHENDSDSVESSCYHDHDHHSHCPQSYKKQPAFMQDRSRRRQDKRRQQMYIQQQQQQQQHDSALALDSVKHTAVNEDDLSSYSSSSLSNISDTVSSAGKPAYQLMLNGYLATAGTHRDQNEGLCHPLSPSTPKVSARPTATGYFDATQPFQHYSKLNIESNMDASQQWLSLAPGIDTGNNHHKQQTVRNIPTAAEDRNILDEAMSFIAGISENGDDGGFQDDFYLLLNHPELLGRPFSEIEPAMHELRKVYYDKQQPQQQLNRTRMLMIAMSRLPKDLCQVLLHYFNGTLYDVTCHTLQWCQFISVLLGAVLISLMRGPDDMRRTPLIVR